jgi:hypothetical protein
LPSSHFDLALLWEHPERVQRRPPSTTAEFPSWSWCGWTGAAAHYRRDILDGCLDDVREWLGRRTWIRWHIRDGNGELRPLWDPEQWEVDVSDQDNWQGYGPFRSSATMLLNGQQTERRTSTYVHANSRYSTPSETADVYVPLPPPRPVRVPHRYQSTSGSDTSSLDRRPRSRTRQNNRSYSPQPARDRGIKYDEDIPLATGRDEAQITDHENDTSDRLPDAKLRLSRDQPKPRTDAPRSRIL